MNKKTKNDNLTSKANPMWGGQFSTTPADILAKINTSIAFDKQLYKQDIAGSIAHAQMLAKQKIISERDAKAIITGLTAILAEIKAGKFIFKETLEDIHMNIESALKDHIGEAAGRLHTARSRNDQVAVDFRLYVRDALDALILQLVELQKALLKRADEHTASIMPGFTHLQTAQPVTLGHHLLAYVEMFARDVSRARDARARLNESPLGAAALAGTSYPIDRTMTAKALGFTAPMANSLDAVSDRDFALEFLSLASICSVHLSRLAEEFIIWSSAPFGFVRFSDAFSTGSSIMPQKRNPDAAELVRGKVGRIVGSLNGLLITMKALPLAYNKDMQEDKEPVFDAVQQISLCVAAMSGMVLDATFNTKAMHTAASGGYATATDLADWLVQKLGLPFREAHHVAAKVVKYAVGKNKMLHELTLKELQATAPSISKDALTRLTVEQSVESRVSYGGTAPANVKKAVAVWKKRLSV